MHFIQHAVLGLVIIIIAIVGAFVVRHNRQTADKSQADNSYNPVIIPSDFTSNITNPLFSLPTGLKLVYQAETAEGPERTEIVIEGKTKQVIGVETLVSRDRNYINGELTEETFDYFAQNKNGDVWYFGEDVDNYEDGKLKDHDGAWLAGVDGAKPGIKLKAANKVGDTYKQEYYKGEAEDTANVAALNQTVSIGRATYHNCVKLLEWTPLDTKSREYKYFCPEVKAMVLIEDLEKGVRSELTKTVVP